MQDTFYKTLGQVAATAAMTTFAAGSIYCAVQLGISVQDDIFEHQQVIQQQQYQQCLQQAQERDFTVSESIDTLVE